jgi:regulator of protease activity HflC (stomatin/prohibitin superfamily)
VIQKTVDKVVYMTGPLLSSRESYAEKKTNLIEWAQDQITNGVYKVVQNTVEATDPISGEKRSTVVAAIATLPEAPAGRARQEQSVVGEFGIHAFNFAVTHVEYSPEVKAQIATQQTIIQNVQKAIAQAREAEQQKITTEQQGQAEAAKTKWAQEAMNAQIVAEAEGRKRAAEQDALAAEAEKRATLSRASGEAEARRLKMAADGALEQKLKAYVDVNAKYADAIAAYRGAWVPTTVMGGSGAGVNGATSLIEMLTIKTARELAVDATPGTTK